jgi:putative pyruvate formate lyase activating enzyme
MILAPMVPQADAREVLPDYFDIQDGKKHARFQVSKSLPVEFDHKAELEELWQAHEKGLEGFRRQDLTDNPTTVKDNLLDLKILIADKILERCQLCERRCKINRKKKTGACGVTAEPHISSEFLHMGEEPELVPSHTIFFSGCTFKCVFCQNWDISQSPSSGEKMAPKKVADIIDRRCGRNVNWVGGDPTSNLPFILEVLRCLDLNVAQVWNSNMYLTKEAMRLLDGTMDIYLADFKYGNDKCGERLSGVKRYFEVVSRNHLEANRQCEMIIRHLVLPGHIACCTKPILDWISKNLDNKRVRVNIMDQYHPDYLVVKQQKKYPELTTKLSSNEWLLAYHYGRDLGLNLE